MNSPSALQGHASGAIGTFSALHREDARPNILIATVNTQLRNEFAELLRPFSVHTIWVKSAYEAKRSLATDNIAVCFCGFWLDGGTYRDVAESAASQPAEIPLIIASASSPAFASEYQHYFAALHIGAFDVIGCTCSGSKFGKILDLALNAHFQSLAGCPVSEANRLSEIHPVSFFHSGGSGLSH